MDKICKRCGLIEKDYSEPKKKPCPECGCIMIRTRKPRYRDTRKVEIYHCTNDNCLIEMRIFTERILDKRGEI